eukprot:6905710-Prymnesium_polylepis.1
MESRKKIRNLCCSPQARKRLTKKVADFFCNSIVVNSKIAPMRRNAQDAPHTRALRAAHPRPVHHITLLTSNHLHNAELMFAHSLTTPTLAKMPTRLTEAV